MSNVSSVTKGCFVYKKKKTKKKSDFFGPKTIKNVNNLSCHSTIDRTVLFNHLWKAFDRAIENAKIDVCSSYLWDLIDFIIKGTNAFDFRKATVEIPTAILLAGVNMPDQDAMYSSLKKMLYAQSTNLVASISHEDTHTVKDLIQKVVSTVINNVSGEDMQKYKCTMSVLAAWYTSYYQHLGNSKVSKRLSRHSSQRDKFSITKGTLPPIVIIIEDLERCPVDVINDFIFICSEYASEIPLTLVLGISTSITAVYNICRPVALSKLTIEAFKMPCSDDYLNFILDEVLLSSKFPFKLSDQLFRHLEERFVCSDFSVTAFMSGLKFFMMEYFYKNPLSVLCCEIKDISERIKTLDNSALEEVRHLLSFRRYVENSSPKLQKLMLLDDTYFKSVIELLITELFEYHNCFFPFLHFFHLLTNDLSGNSFKRQLRDLYCISLEKDLIESLEIQEYLKILRLMSKEELSIKLKQGLDYLKKCKTLPTSIEMFRDTIQSIIRKVDGCVESYECIEGRILEDEVHGNRRQQICKPKEVFDILKEEAICIIEESVRKFLRCHRYVALHEIMYFDDVEVKHNSVGNNQKAIQEALGNPHKYLQCQCCILDSVDSISPALPDLCVAYKLHMECPRIINLCDWLQAFISVIDSQLLDSESRSDQHKHITTVGLYSTASTE